MSNQCLFNFLYKRLMSKLRIYGVQGILHTWIDAFLSGHKQRVIVEASSSEEAPVTSGVPQGTVLGPLLFLLFINDLPSVLDPGSKCRIFADDCLIYKQITTFNDQAQLQSDLTALEKWSEVWGMQFNAKKCNIMTIAQSTPLVYFTN
jgi:ribonuclease P/MRP protein subunit RPP40